MINYQDLATAFILHRGKAKEVPAALGFYEELHRWCEANAIGSYMSLAHYFTYRYRYDFLKRPHDGPSGCGQPRCHVCTAVWT